MMFQISKTVDQLMKNSFSSKQIKFVYLFLLLSVNLLNATIADSLKANLAKASADEKVKAYISLVKYYTKTSPDKNDLIENEALQFAKSQNDNPGYADLILSFGSSYHNLSDYDTALRYFKIADSLYRAEKDSVRIGISLNKIGRNLISRGKYDEALESLQESIRILENQDEKNALGDSYNFYAILQYIIGEREKAGVLTKNAVEFCEKLDDELILAQALEHYAIYWIWKRDYDKALELAHRSYNLREKNQDKLGMAGSLTNMALIKRITKNYEESLKYYERALSLQREANYIGGVALSLTGLGRIYNVTGDYKKALEYLLQAYNIRKESRNRRGVVTTLELLSEIYAKMNNYEKSLEYLKLHKVQNDSLLNEQKQKNIAELQESFASERREQEILLLQKENTIHKNQRTYLLIMLSILSLAAIFIYLGYSSKRKLTTQLEETNRQVTDQKNELLKINLRLKKVLETRDSFFSIIAHDLKSPFQGLMGIIEIIIKDFDELKKEEVREHLVLVKNSADGVYNLVINLLEWANLQRDKLNVETKTFNLRQLVEDIAVSHKIIATNKKVKIENLIDKNLTISTDRNMFSAVIRNLISNAIKFCDAGDVVTVFTEKSNNSISICVEDTGIGIPSKIIPELFKVGEKVSRPGTRDEKSNGLGLILCKEYVEKLNGNIRVESEEGVGSKFFVELLQ
ncbi:MAG: hypothetical protein SCALA702_06430 [Melioribacteraceae bacterium]|nr:MAG: hypothetical protein SCALA702_06430 [Melioribacteraceae bacterium]